MLKVKKEYEKYLNLLTKNEKNLPNNVKKTIDFFSSHNIWYKLSRNQKAYNCKDAAKKRNRLGHTGIPLEHELRSYFGKFINAAGAEQFVVLHCSGNQKLDFDKINKVLNISKDKLKRLTEVELAKLFNVEPGMVNPFSLDSLFLGARILQVFDQSLEENHRSPYTMMTNAGDLTWGIEFKSNDLLEKIDHSKVENIVKDDFTRNGNKKTRLHKIGVLTGNSPESGILLWIKIIQIIRGKLGVNFLGALSVPNIIVESKPDIGLSIELDLREDETWRAVKEGIMSLCKQGAIIICIPCNTTQYFTPRIREITSQYKAKFISTADVTLKYLESNKIKEFAFLGTKYVTELDNKWSDFKRLRKFNVEILSEENIEQLHRLAFIVKQEGISGAGINNLRDLLNQNIQSKNVVIALNEISILLDNQKKKSKKKRNYIDTLDLLAEAVADEYLSAVQSY